MCPHNEWFARPAGCLGYFVDVAGLILWIVLAIAVTNSINDCFNQPQTTNSDTACGTNTNTGDSGDFFNSGSTGNTLGPLHSGGVQQAHTAGNSATSPGSNVSLLG
jgi:hypothetical protein